MTATTLHDILERLAAQEAELARLRRRVARGAYRQRRSWGAVVAALALVLIVALPLGVLAADPFDDLDPAQSGDHNPNIALIASAGITKGCNPPINTKYCPKDYVTREQMASFLARTAGLGANPPVANAAKVGGYPANNLTRVAIATNFNDNPINDVEADVLSTTLDVPLQGYVLVQFTGYWYAQLGSGCPCTAVAYLRMDGNSQRVAEQNLNNNGTLNYDREAASGSYVFLAPAGTHTFAVRARRSSGTSTTIGLAKLNLQAILLPFGSGGGVATDLPIGGGESPSSSDR